MMSIYDTYMHGSKLRILRGMKRNENEGRGKSEVIPMRN
jgi:hypothetical protein